MDEVEYIGKLILIGISFVSKNDELIEQYQTHGYIEKIEKNGLMRIRRDGLPVFTIPFNKSAISKAKPGTYRERSSGMEIENPDFFTSWSVRKTKTFNIEKYKKYGFEEFTPENTEMSHNIGIKQTPRK